MDDILVAGSDLDEVERIKRQFTKHYEMKDLGELGMKITKYEEYIKLDQSAMSVKSWRNTVIYFVARRGKQSIPLWSVI